MTLGYWWYAFIVGLLVEIVLLLLMYANIEVIYLFGTEDVYDPTNFNVTTMFNDPVYFLLSAVAYLIELFLGIVIIVTFALIYFSIQEHKFPSYDEEIESLGIE